ncbi:MAG: hypothetical protein WD114_02825 [Phycisphaerales bacterium]
MRTDRLHFAATVLFALGFVLTTSGWAPLIAWSMQDRPAYSVCGQDLCLCLPTTAPDCPLCEVKSTPEGGCNESAVPTRAPKRVPDNERFDTMTDASQAGCVSLFLAFAFGARSTANFASVESVRFRIAQESVPADPLGDIPAPPPRF